MNLLPSKCKEVADTAGKQKIHILKCLSVPNDEKKTKEKDDLDIFFFCEKNP